MRNNDEIRLSIRLFSCITKAPSAPRQLKAEERSGTSVTLSWQRPNSPHGNIKLYRVYFQDLSKKDPPTTGEEFRSSKAFMSFELKGLKPSTKYRIYVSLLS